MDYLVIIDVTSLVGIKLLNETNFIAESNKFYFLCYICVFFTLCKMCMYVAFVIDLWLLDLLTAIQTGWKLSKDYYR